MNHDENLFDDYLSEGCCANCGAAQNFGPEYGNYVDLLLAEGYAPFCSTACITAFVKSEAGRARLQYVPLRECKRSEYFHPCKHCIIRTQNNVGQVATCFHPDGEVTEEPAPPEYDEEYDENIQALSLYGGYGPYDGGTAFCSTECLADSFNRDHPNWDAKNVL